MDLSSTLLIAQGGALGTMARYLIALAALPISGSLPWGTILIDVAGSFMIGFAGTLTLSHGRHPLPETARLFVMMGSCGGFTTFSSFTEIEAGKRNATVDLIGAVALALAVPVAALFDEREDARGSS